MNDNFKVDIKAKGEVGVKWLKDIPEIIQQLEKDRDINIGEAFDLYFNYVVSAILSDGTKVQH